MGSGHRCGAVLWLAGQSESGEVVHQFRYKPCGSKHCPRCWPHWREQRVARIFTVLSGCPYSSTNSFFIGQIRTSQDSLKRALRRGQVSWVAIPQRDGSVAYLAGWERDGWKTLEDIEATARSMFYRHDRSKYVTSSSDMNLAGKRLKDSGLRLVRTGNLDLERLAETLGAMGLDYVWVNQDAFTLRDYSVADLERALGRW